VNSMSTGDCNTDRLLSDTKRCFIVGSCNENGWPCDKSGLSFFIGNDLTVGGETVSFALSDKQFDDARE